MVIKNEEVLLPDYLPETLPHREGQIKLLAENLIPLSKHRKGINTFIYGPPGIGKTAVVKYVFRELSTTSPVKTIYLNCWDFNTSFAILTEITIRLGLPVARRGWAKDEIMQRLTEALEKLKTGVAVALDEVDQLIHKDQKALYDLLRINQYTSTPLTLVFVSNDRYIFSKVEPRIKSSLALDEIEFRPYTFLEMKDIVEERIRKAFTAVEPGVSALVASQAIRSSDVRVALDILLKAGRLAEKEGAKKLLVRHVKSVIVKNPKERIIYENLSENEKIIYDALTEPMSTKELYEKLKESISFTERAFRNYVNHMIESGAIEVVGMKDKARVVKRKEW